MFEQQPDDIRNKVKTLATEAIANSDPTAWFEVLYTEAEGDSDRVPWARMHTHEYLQPWLEDNAIRGNNRTALVIGCGLGDDAEALQALGFQVTAFDIAPSAIAWCQQRFPHSRVNYLVADLFAMPAQWQQAFDFVLEIRDIQALPLSVRSRAIASVASAVAPGGTLLIITRLRDTEAEPEGPPWALSAGELEQFIQLGLREIQRQLFIEEGQPDVKQVRIEYRKLEAQLLAES